MSDKEKKPIHNNRLASGADMYSSLRIQLKSLHCFGSENDKRYLLEFETKTQEHLTFILNISNLQAENMIKQYKLESKEARTNDFVSRTQLRCMDEFHLIYDCICKYGKKDNQTEKS